MSTLIGLGAGLSIIISIAIALAILFMIERFIPNAGNSAFKQKWPAISDDEFIARCPPGTSRETAIKFRQIVSEQLGIPYDHVYPEQNFVNDLGCD